MIEIVNRQRKIDIAVDDFREFAESAAGLVPEASGRSITIAFVSDRTMRRLNRSFLGSDATTDVLSFPMNDEADEPTAVVGMHLGDIAISVEQARRQGPENGLDLATEIKQLILHGILHLCGWDHQTDKGEMNAMELKLRDKLAVS